jgi:hypothetical protein
MTKNTTSKKEARHLKLNINFRKSTSLTLRQQKISNMGQSHQFNHVLCVSGLRPDRTLQLTHHQKNGLGGFTKAELLVS